MRDESAGTGPGTEAESAQLAALRGLMDEALVGTMERLGAHGGGIALVEPGGEIMRTKVGVGLPPDFAAPLHSKRLTTTVADPLVEAVRERTLVWIASGEEFARRYPRPARILPHHAMAVAPIVSGTTVWGVVQLFWPAARPAELSPLEQSTITAAAARLAGLLQAAAEAGTRLLPPRQPRFLPLRRRAAAGPAEAAAAVDFAARLPEGGCALAPDGRVTFADHTAAELLGVSVSRLVGARLWEALPWLRDPVYEQSHRQAILSQQPASCTALRPPDRHLLLELYPDPTGVSVRISPGPAGVRPVGQPPAATAADAGPTRLGAIHHLMHLAGELTQARGVPDVFELVSDHFLLAFGAQGCALVVAEAGRMRIIGSRGFRAEALRRLDGIPLTSDTPGVVGLTAGVPSFFADRGELARHHPERAAIDDGMAAWSFLPLIASGRPVGTCVLGYRQPHRFTTEERLTLTSFSGLISQALDRARLYDAKNQLARGLQAGLLPHALPWTPGLDQAVRYLPAGFGMDIGGDFYDLIRVGPAAAVAVIGDVQGHNVTAAALMGHLRTAVHAYALAGAPPGGTLVRTNRLITDLDPELLSSCLYAHLDLARHRARIATAGHCPPLLRRPGHRAGVLHLAPGPLLGAAAASAYPTTEVSLPPGTVLAMYTDGLIELPGTDHEDNLRRLVAALDRGGESLDGIADALVEETQPAGDRTDDTALLLLRVA